MAIDVSSSAATSSSSVTPRRADGLQRNQNPTRIKSFFFQNQNNARRYLLPIIFGILAVLYFYNLLIRDVGSGVHVRRTLDKTLNENTAPVGIPSSTAQTTTVVSLEPRSLADVAIANAEMAWKRQLDREQYLRRRSEQRQELMRKKEAEERAEKEALKKASNNTTGTISGGLYHDSVMSKSINATTTDEDYIKKLIGLQVKRTPSRKNLGPGPSHAKTTSQAGHGDGGGGGGLLPLMLMMISCTIFRLCLSSAIERFAEDHPEVSLPEEEPSESEDERGGGRSRGGFSSFMTNISGGREAVRLRRRARAARAQRQFQAFVDRLNIQREQNGERQISAESLRLVVSSRDFTGNDYDRLWQFNEENGPAVGSFFSSIGATDAEINRCPSRTLEEGDDLLRPRTQQQEADRANDEHRCSVCLEQYQVGDVVRTIPCFHSFHASCIDPWMREKAECPVCKHSAIG